MNKHPFLGTSAGHPCSIGSRCRTGTQVLKRIGHQTVVHSLTLRYREAATVLYGSQHVDLVPPRPRTRLDPSESWERIVTFAGRVAYEAQSHGSCTRCLRFAVEVTLRPRKTRLWPAGWALTTRDSHPLGNAARFQDYIGYSFLLARALPGAITGQFWGGLFWLPKAGALVASPQSCGIYPQGWLARG
jgi:hypothetical protein